MNEITEKAVRTACKKNPGLARNWVNVGDDIHIERLHQEIDNEWWGLIMNEIGADIRLRAEHITKLRHPEIFDDDGLIDDHYYDVACFSRMVNRAIDNKIKLTPKLQLEPYEKLMLQLHPKQLELF